MSDKITYQETLYKRARTGSIQYWKISVESHPDKTATIIKETGKLNTENPVFHKDHITSGKNLGKSNETSPLEQATFQAMSDYKRKQDDGYKDLNDFGLMLMQDGSVFHESSEVGYSDLHTALDYCLPKQNTDASGQVKPMLAHSFDDVKDIEYPVIVQRKYDGHRCIMIVKDGEVKLLSRQGKEITTMDHITDLVKEHPLLQEADFILDGELYYHGDLLSFQDIGSAIKKKKDSSVLIKYYVYDVISAHQQESRLNHASDIVEELGNPFIVCHPWDFAVDKQQVIELHNSYVSIGYEGAMVRFPNGKYSSSRSSELLKVKIYEDSEFEFIGFELGKRGTQDLLAVCLTSEGLEFKPTMSGTVLEKSELYDSWRKGVIKTGDLLTVQYFGVTDLKIPRHPVGKAFRDDI